MPRRYKSKKITVNGIRFDSIYESEVYLNYPELLREPMAIKYQKMYYPDFLLIAKSGKAILIECKGVFTKDDRSKLRAVRESNPDIDVRLMFMDARKRVKGTKMTYGSWCTKNKFQWCEGTQIPRAWILE